MHGAPRRLLHPPGSYLSPHWPGSPARRATCCFLSLPWPLILVGLCLVVFSAGATVTFFAPLSSPSTCSYRGPFPDATLADRSTLSSELAPHGVLQCTPEVSLLSQRPTQACSCPTLAVTVLQVQGVWGRCVLLGAGSQALPGLLPHHSWGASSSP